MNFHVIAHRGWSEAHSENTIDAFTAALTHARVVELDVRHTRDGAAVCYHDATLARVHDDKRRLDEIDVDELASIAADVPLFSAVIEQLGRRCGWFVEFKDAGHAIESGVRRTLASSGIDTHTARRLRTGRALAAGSAAIEAADPEILWRMRRADPAVGCLQMLPGHVPSWKIALIAPVITLYAHGVVISERRLTVTLVRCLHAFRLGVYAYTVNEAQRASELRTMGVDAVFSDAPDRVK